MTFLFRKKSVARDGGTDVRDATLNAAAQGEPHNNWPKCRKRLSIGLFRLSYYWNVTRFYQ